MSYARILADLRQTSLTWDQVCDRAEAEMPPIAKHLETWGPHCGAPRSVYRGHLVKMLVDIGEMEKSED